MKGFSKNKKGISLIVLVITIIVMIILATAIILSLNGSGIIGKANEAKTSSDLANAKHVAALAKAEWDLMTDEEQEKEGDSLKKYVEDKLKEAGFKDGVVNNNGEIVTTYTIYTDSAKKTAPIPNGFTVSTIPGETTISGGLVIYEGTEPVTNVDSDSNGIIDAQETRNQFVWVPVDVPEGKTFDEIFQRTTTYRPTEDITSPDKNYYAEPASNVCTNYNYREGECIDSKLLSLTNDVTGEWKEEKAMKESVEANGGFYIGRYEAGTVAQRKYDTNNGTSDVLIQKNKNAYTYVTWGQNAGKIDGDIIDFDSNNQGKSAVILSRNVFNGSESVVSTLCYGVQWDAALRFIATEYEDYPTYSTDRGNYTNGLKKTGLNENCKVKNIYDMAGNVDEWTMEIYTYDSSRIVRGGGYGYSEGDPYIPSASFRIGEAVNTANDHEGFRITLYII